MEFRQLRYFLAVAEHLHFSAAAGSLGIAQPPLSQQILKLEREIGTKLFVRHSRHVELTEAGRLFRERAQRIVEEAGLALAEAQNAGRGETGRLSLGFAGSTVFHPLVATVLQRYRSAWPGVAIGCEESNSSLLLDRVSEARVDAAFVRLPLDCRGLATQALVEEDVLAALPPRHRLARRRRLDLAELAGDPLILFPRAIGPDLYDSIISACHAAGFNPVVGMESPQISSTVNMAAAGFGVTLIPASMRQIQAKGVTYHEVKGGTLHTTIALVYRPRERAPTVQNFVRIVHDTARHAPQRS